MYFFFLNNQLLFDIPNPVNLGWAGICNPPTKTELESYKYCVVLRSGRGRIWTWIWFPSFCWFQQNPLSFLADMLKRMDLLELQFSNCVFPWWVVLGHCCALSPLVAQPRTTCPAGRAQALRVLVLKRLPSWVTHSRGMPSPISSRCKNHWHTTF